MCNDYGNRVDYRTYLEAFAEVGLPLVRPGPHAAPNLEPRDEIWPTETAPLFRSIEEGVELTQVRWGLAPPRPKAPVVINMRSEGRRFVGGRCLVPASHYYEFTGTKSPKVRWRFTRTDTDWFCFAGLLGRGQDGGREVEAFTLLTVEAGADVLPIHARQPAIVERGRWREWLQAEQAPHDILHPAPAGSLRVVEAARGTVGQRDMF